MNRVITGFQVVHAAAASSLPPRQRRGEGEYLW